MNRHFKLCIIFTAVLVSLWAVLYQTNSASHSFNQALDRYNFSTPEQKEALRQLFEQAAIAITPTPHNDSFAYQGSKQELVQAIITAVKETQAKFVVRTGTQERWEVEPLAWTRHNTKNIVAALQTLGFVDAIKPRCREVDAICILGATRGRMIDRIAYADLLVEKGVRTHAIIFLTGERYVTIGVDGTEAELTEIAQASAVDNWTKLTETHVAKYIYAHSNLQQRGIASYVIDTLAGNLPRPTTQTTMLELMKWLRQHPEVKRIIFVSNQPYVQYQKALIQAILEDSENPGDSIAFEVVGQAVTKLDTPQPILEGLGSYLWAATPHVLRELHATITEPTARKELEELYAKNPLLYNCIPFTKARAE